MAFIESMKAKYAAVKARESTLIEQAKRRIPAPYHDFLLLLDQNMKIGPKADEPSTIGPDVWSSDRSEGTFVPVKVPYVSVDGRVQMAVDEHRAAGKRLSVKFLLASERMQNPPEEFKSILTCIVESDIYGTFEGSAKIAWSGAGVDRTNPYENAQTSAYGRALGNMGYGLIGSGIASFEEVREALKEQSTLESPKSKVAAPPPPPKPSADPTAARTPAPETAVTDAASAPTPPMQDNAATDPSNPDPALFVDSGPCADCGVILSKGMEQYVKNQRKAGKGLRWSHRSLPGLDSIDEHGKCNANAVLKLKTEQTA